MKEKEQNYHLNHVSEFNYISLNELIAQGQREMGAVELPSFRKTQGLEPSHSQSSSPFSLFKQDYS